jgi:hypothetical protein
MKRNEIIVHEHKKGVRAVKYNQKPQATIEPPKPKNPVAKNANAAIGGGAAGAHKDAKKASQAVRGQKHKNAEMAEGYNPNSVSAEHRRELEAHRRKEAEKRAAAGDEKAKQWLERDDERRANMRAEYDRRMERESAAQEGYRNYDDNRTGFGDQGKREFKRREMEHELGHEDDPDFERKLRQQQMDKDRGPWYLKVDGKILKVKGDPKVFDWKKGANNYALAILKNKPELQGKIFLTKKSEDDVSEMGSEVGKITKVDPMTKKATLTKPDGSSMEVDSTALKPTADGKMQMDTPDANQIKTGTSVVSTEDMMEPPTDSSSPIPGDNDHDEISKLLVHRLRRLAGL